MKDRTSLVLPESVAAYFNAEESLDFEALARCFADDAVVRDEGRTIVAHAAIKQWMKDAKAKYQHTVEPLESAEIKGGKIASLEIH